MFSLKPHITLIILLLFACATALQAQSNLSAKGKFTVNNTKGCSSLAVKVDAVAGKTFGDLVYRYRYEGVETANVSPPVTFQLTKPGTYWIIQFENSSPGRPSEKDSIRVEVFEPESPSFQAYICTGKRVFVEVDQGIYDYYIAKTPPSGPEVRLDADNNFQAYMDFASAGVKDLIVEGRFSNFGNDTGCGISQKEIVVAENLLPPKLAEVRADIKSKKANFKYDIQLNTFQVLEAQIGGSGNFVTLDTLEGNETTIEMPEIGSEYICFRITTYDFCNQGNNRSSSPLCTSSLKGISSLNGNEIIYRTAPSDDLQNVTLTRDGQEIHNFKESSNGSFADKEVNCKNTYQYGIRLTFEDGISITENLEIRTEIQGELKPAENIISSWKGNAVLFTIALTSPPEGGRYFGYLKKGTSFSEVSRSDSSTVKVSYSPDASCPAFGYSDDCGNKSALSHEVCPVYLRNISDQPDGLHLEWNEYEGYKEGVDRYVVEKIGSNGQVLQEVYQGGGTNVNLGEQALEESGSIYQVKAYPFNSSLEASTSNPFDFQINTEPYFPNAFTPGTDGKNDYFRAEGKFVSGLALEIFNSWGEMVYRTQDMEQGWDGTINGKPAPQGVYGYKAEVTTEDNKKYLKQGTVFILRR